ncbi:hypothetical protein DEO72_LG1g2111 [Vigna unguiculata]|uniref:Uncharacterized protein n=1 Tax=Vigna unguiculata TaxID=3917 RepID=A0A4D6KLP4_VIGUN|nr:hypothetical protein DEO72_LG1g2111 [Vigna unguiculata]
MEKLRERMNGGEKNVSPAPPASTSVAHVYRAHDHHQTQVDRLITEEGNPFGPIRTGHNQNTHTGNTRQPELNSRLITEEGNPFALIRTGHNQNTHTGNTRQPERNSRVPRVHPPSRAQLEGCHSELNSRNATCLTLILSSTQGIRSKLNSRNTSNPTFEAPPKPCRLRIQNPTSRDYNIKNRLAGDMYCQAQALPDRLVGDTYR